VFGVFALSLLRPFYFWEKAIMNYSFVFFFILFCMLALYKFKLNPRKTLLSFSVIILLFSSFNYRQLLQGGSILGATHFLMSSFIWIFAFSEELQTKKTWKFFIWFFSLILIPGIIIYYLRFFLPIPFKEIAPLNTLKTYNYLTFWGSLFPNTIDSIRFIGVFDEPGALGTYSALIIGFDRFRNKGPCLIIFFAGIMSFSLAFYILLIFFIFFQFKNKGKWIIVLLSFFFLSSLFEPSRALLIDRLVITPDYTLSGDNRDKEEFKITFRNFIDSKEQIFWGKGPRSSRIEGAEGGSSIRMFFFEYGLWGFLVVLMIYLFLLSQYRTYHNLVMLIAFMLSMYQRPEIYAWSYLYLFYFGALFDYLESKQERSSPSEIPVFSSERGDNNWNF